MAQATWEKPAASVRLSGRKSSQRIPYLIGGGLILAAVIYLLVSGTLLGARYFITVDDLVGNAEYAGQTVRVAGAVIGDSITYDPESLLITFTVAHVQEPYTDLAEALHAAVTDPNATRLNVRVENQVRPELLQHEAQAIMTGYLGEDGIFHVSELNLKCPTRFVEDHPDQSIANTGA